MDKYQEIADYTKTDGRNKIVFCQSKIDGIWFKNVGQELSLALQDGNTPIDTYGFVADSLSHSFTDDSIGNYMAIQNIGILFEPELQLDVRRLFDTLSQNQCLIICSEAVVENQKLHYPQHEQPFVDLQGLSYISI